MANTFTLRIKERTLDGIKPTSVTVTIYPLATEAGKRLKQVDDTNGDTRLSGHVKHTATPSEIAAGVVDIALPDPRDLSLMPSGFGYEVHVVTNYFTPSVVRFGPAQITEYINSGVVALEDVDENFDPADFHLSVVGLDLDSPNFTGTPTVDGVPLTPFALIENDDGTVTITVGNTVIDGGQAGSGFTQFQVIDGGTAA